MQYDTFTDSSSQRIPRRQGMYAFFLDLVSPAKIGLAGKGPWDEATLKLAKSSLLRRIEKQMAVVHSVDLAGLLVQPTKFGPLQTAFSMNARKKSQFDVAAELKELSLSSVREYSAIIHDTATFAQPLYVGITYDQTLLERYRQHRASYFSPESDSGFGARIRELAVEWDDLIFSCRPINVPVVDGFALRTAERQLQSITHPICSLK
jgi:hypothetical protein